MLKTLFGELVRRRLWPVALVAAVVAVAAPALFLKSAPPDAPAGVASAAPAAATDRLPARARRLLAAAGEDAATGSRPPARSASDPFEAPASSRSSKSASSKSDEPTDDGEITDKPADTTSPEPIPVVIANPDGTVPATSSPQIGGQDTTPAPPPATVDVRFGERYPARLYRDIPRLQTFVAGGQVAAIFVKYSPARDKAVFAIAPSTTVGGDIECRRKEGVCRYVDIPAGKYVRLTTTSTGGAPVTRRLDVAGITPAGQSGVTAGAASPANGSCLLGKLLNLTADDPPLAGDDC